jgi:hypothetical protein
MEEWMEKQFKKIDANGVLADFQRLWDCLIAIEKIQDEHPDSYNDVISCLIIKAKDIVEDGMRDVKTEGNRR